jgi:hypothetical protein
MRGREDAETTRRQGGVGARLPARLFAEVEAYAERHGLTPAEALPYLVVAGLEAEARAMLDGADGALLAAWRPDDGAGQAAALIQAANDEDRACPDRLRGQRRDGPSNTSA